MAKHLWKKNFKSPTYFTFNGMIYVFVHMVPVPVCSDHAHALTKCNQSSRLTPALKYLTKNLQPF